MMNSANLAKEFNGQLIKGIVTEVDMGQITASVTVQSGNRMISVMLSVSEVIKSGVKAGGEVFCLISGKDITLITDIKEYMTRLQKKNPNLETYLIQ
jgi:molybdopterin-binding protein